MAPSPEDGTGFNPSARDTAKVMESVTEVLEPLYPTSTGRPGDLGREALGGIPRRDSSDPAGGGGGKDGDGEHRYRRPRPVPEVRTSTGSRPHGARIGDPSRRTAVPLEAAGGIEPPYGALQAPA